MIESISERQVIASQLKQMRSLEKSKNYRESDWDRDINDYLYWFNGLSQVFKYAKQLNSESLIFDLGAGTTKGAENGVGDGFGTLFHFKPAEAR